MKIAILFHERCDMTRRAIWISVNWSFVVSVSINLLCGSRKIKWSYKMKIQFSRSSTPKILTLIGEHRVKWAVQIHDELKVLHSQLLDLTLEQSTELQSLAKLLHEFHVGLLILIDDSGHLTHFDGNLKVFRRGVDTFVTFAVRRVHWIRQREKLRSRRMASWAKWVDGVFFEAWRLWVWFFFTPKTAEIGKFFYRNSSTLSVNRSTLWENSTIFNFSPSTQRWTCNSSLSQIDQISRAIDAAWAEASIGSFD